jgi:hypothetical protein
MNSGEQCVVVAVLMVNAGNPLLLQTGEWVGSDAQWGAVRGGGADGQCR